MKVLILAYHVESVSDAVLWELTGDLKKHFNITTFIVPHHDKDADPIYSVQWISDESNRT